MQNFAAIAVVSVTWVVLGFTWAFGGTNKYLGDRVAQVLEHLHEPPAPNGSREPPASKS